MTFKEFLDNHQRKKVEDFSVQNLNDITVSVCVMVYNHANYISRCLDGILNQRTNFKFEILIGEDASSDESRDICLEYAREYPDKIRLFIHSRENNIRIGGKATGRFNFIYCLFSSKGKYIALCDGDDYWTDPLKLSKQVNCLDNNINLIACGHPAFVVDSRGSEVGKKIGDFPNSIFTKKDFSTGYKRIPTASLLFRNVISDIPHYFTQVYGGDRALLYLLSQKGNIKILDFVGSAYRMHGGSLEANYRNNRIEKRNLAERNIQENRFYLRIVEPDYKSDLAKKVRWNYLYLFLLNIMEIKILDAMSLIPCIVRFQLVVMGVHRAIP